MSPPKYVFNHIMITDGELWYIYHKLDKRIPKTVEHYGSRFVASGSSESICLKNFVSQGGKPWDVQIVLPKNLESKTLKN